METDGTGWARLGPARKSSQAGWQSLSIWSAIWLDLLYLSMYLSIYLSIYWLFAPSPNHQLCLLLPRVCFIQDVSRDLFWEDLGKFKSLWEFILASIWRKTRSVLRSRFSTALWVPFGTVFGAPGPPQKEPFWKPFRLMLPSRGALRLKIEDFFGGGVWLQSLFLKRFCVIFGGVLGSENIAFAWEG